MTKLYLVPYPQKVKLTNDYCCYKLFYRTDKEEILLKTIEEEIGSVGDLQIQLIQTDFENSEAYRLQIHQNSVIIFAKSKEGFLYGALTLKQLIKQFNDRLPCLTIEDYPVMRHRGVQVCYAQVNVEYREKWLKRFIRQMADIKINYIYLYFEWNFAFPSLPPTSHKNHLTPEIAKDIIEFSKKYNITIVPSLNILGHTADFLSAQIYDNLKEYDNEQSIKSNQGTSLCISNPDTIKLVSGILNDIMDIFDSEIIHVGGDEVEFIGVCPLCKDEANRIGRMGLYLKYFIFIRDMLKNRCRKMGIWGDQLMNFSSFNRYWCKKPIEEQYLDFNKKQLAELIENTIVFDWWYDGESLKSIQFFSELGFEFISTTSTHGCMTSSINLGQQLNQHALLRDAIQYDAAGGLISEWINYLGYHTEQMSFNFASGASMMWTGCDGNFIKGISRDEFEKAYSFLRYYDKTDSLRNYLHFSGDSNGELLSLFPPSHRGVALRKYLFFSNNPLDFYLWQVKNFENGKSELYFDKIHKLNQLWDKVMETSDDDGYLVFLKLPVLLHTHFSKRFKACDDFYDFYNKASKVQYIDQLRFCDLLDKSVHSFKIVIDDFDELILYTKQMTKMLGSEEASTMRLVDTKNNFNKLINFIVSLKDNRRPLPTLTVMKEMLFDIPKTEYAIGRSNEWYKEKSQFKNYEVDNQNACMSIDF